MSHPAWVCGLKPLFLIILGSHDMSHPAWVCGLKLNVLETASVGTGHTLRGCVD